MSGLRSTAPTATSVGRQRPIALVGMLLAGVIVAWGAVDFFLL